MKILATTLGLLLALAAAMPAAAEDHSAHHAAAAGGGLKRSEKLLQVAAVKMVRQDGRRLDFDKALDDGRPVMLNFVYTSCTAICPVTAQVFADVRERLGADRDAVHVVSVSIDPDYDTPSRMAAYAQRFSPGGAWSFFTGSQQESVAVQQSFGAYQGDKMNHLPVTFVRAAPGKPWVRLDGFASPSVLMDTIRPMLRPAMAAAGGKAAISQR